MLPAGGGTPRSLQPRRALACHHLDPSLGCTHSRCNTPKLYTQARLSALLATGAGKRVAAPVTMTHTMSVSIGRGGAAEQPAVPLAPLAADAATAAGGPEELQSRIVHGLYDALLAADVPFDQLASPPPPPPPPPPLSISGPSLARRARPQTWSETADAGRAHTTQPPEHRGSWGNKQRPTTLHGGRAADEMLAGLSKRQQHRHLQYQEVHVPPPSRRGCRQRSSNPGPRPKQVVVQQQLELHQRQLQKLRQQQRAQEQLQQQHRQRRRRRARTAAKLGLGSGLGL